MMVIGPPTLCRSACGRGLEILMVFTNTTEDVPARHVLNFSSNDTEDVPAGHVLNFPSIKQQSMMSFIFLKKYTSYVSLHKIMILIIIFTKQIIT